MKSFNHDAASEEEILENIKNNDSFCKWVLNITKAHIEHVDMQKWSEENNEYVIAIANAIIDKMNPQIKEIQHVENLEAKKNIQ